jgi:LuxR family maltose regulon positive regulatory protein
MLGAWVHACLGRAPEATQWLAIAETGQGNGPLLDGLTTLHPWQALVRAVLCEGGVERMLVDAEVAVSELPPTSPWRPVAQLLAGAALALLGDADRAEAMLADAADTAEALGATDTCVAALSERALVAADRGDNASAEHLSERARLVAAGADVDAPIAGALEAALFARTLLRRRTWNEARDQLASADRLPAGPSRAFPWLAVQAQLELAGAYLTLRDPGAAQAAVAAAREILDHMPWLGLLDEQAAALQQAIDDLRDSQQAEDFGLTPAELRLIPLLASHLSFPEIGARFFLSRNTIKTQAISIYRKLGASSRSEAVERARSVGLLDGALGATGEGDDHVQAQALAG